MPLMVFKNGRVDITGCIKHKNVFILPFRFLGRQRVFRRLRTTTKGFTFGNGQAFEKA